MMIARAYLRFIPILVMAFAANCRAEVIPVSPPEAKAWINSLLPLPH